MAQLLGNLMENLLLKVYKSTKYFFHLKHLSDLNHQIPVIVLEFRFKFTTPLLHPHQLYEGFSQFQKPMDKAIILPK